MQLLPNPCFINLFKRVLIHFAIAISLCRASTNSIDYYNGTNTVDKLSIDKEHYHMTLHDYLRTFVPRSLQEYVGITTGYTDYGESQVDRHDVRGNERDVSGSDNRLECIDFLWTDIYRANKGTDDNSQTRKFPELGDIVWKMSSNSAIYGRKTAHSQSIKFDYEMIMVKGDVSEQYISDRILPFLKDAFAKSFFPDASMNTLCASNSCDLFQYDTSRNRLRKQSLQSKHVGKSRDQVYNNRTLQDISYPQNFVENVIGVVALPSDTINKNADCTGNFTSSTSECHRINGVLFMYLDDPTISVLSSSLNHLSTGMSEDWYTCAHPSITNIKLHVVDDGNEVLKPILIRSPSGKDESSSILSWLSWVVFLAIVMLSFVISFITVTTVKTCSPQKDIEAAES